MNSPTAVDESLATVASPPQVNAAQTARAWNEKYSVGVGLLDRQHKGLFDAINEVQAVVKEGDESLVGPLLNKLAEWTRAHFASEQAMMANSKYAGLALHILKHQYLLEQLDAFVARYKRGGSKLNEYSLNFLRDWLTMHILKEDMIFGLWLNEKAKQ